MHRAAWSVIKRAWSISTRLIAMSFWIIPWNIKHGKKEIRKNRKICGINISINVEVTEMTRLKILNGRDHTIGKKEKWKQSKHNGKCGNSSIEIVWACFKTRWPHCWMGILKRKKEKKRCDVPSSLLMNDIKDNWMLPFLLEVLRKQFLTSHVHTLVPRLSLLRRLFSCNDVFVQAPSGLAQSQNHVLHLGFSTNKI